MTAAAKKTRSQKIKDDAAIVQITARTGRLPIISDSEEWINPTTKRTVPGVVLEFGDNGLCELHPVHDAEKIKVFNEWLEEGIDPRIVEQGVMVVKQDNLVPMFPRWNVTNETRIMELVEEMGWDIDLCLRYELQNLNRPKLVKALEKKVDAPVEDDPLAEPEL